MNRLQRIREFPCCQCHASPPSQAAHANWQEFGKGMGKKADDAYTIPLCHICHKKFDTYQGQDRQKAKAWFLRKLALVNQWLDNKQYQDGVDF